MKKKRTNFLWWHTGIIYQVYPRSFMDTDNDGVGDLRGIIRKLNYLKELGVTAIWLSPVYPSPMADFGYDISDYRSIHPLFGTMKDFDKLLEEVHKRGLKLVMDLVPNHSSEEHPWFLESRSSRDNPKRDWYLWYDPAPGGGPPNNWLSAFGGSGWEWDEKTSQYYFHSYLREQPDLNWRNPEVKEEMYNIMRFWLDKGVDGFRVDVMWHMIKDERLRNNPPNPGFGRGMSPYFRFLPAYSVDQPEVHDIVKEMRKVTDEYDERVLIGEIYLPVSSLVTYYGSDSEEEAHLPFNFQLITLPWDAREIAAAIDQYEGALPEGAWPNWVLGNHDKHRIATRVGPRQARIAAILLLTLRGTPTMYYGDELGMKNVFISSKRIQDPHEKNIPGLGLGRDPERTPMQWDATENAGFTGGTPWLPLGRNYRKVNVSVQMEEEGSMLQFYKRLIKLRIAEPALHSGNFRPLEASGNLLAYIRRHEEQKWLIVLNLGSGKGSLTITEIEVRGKVELGTHPDKEAEKITNKISLRGNEGIVVRLEPA